MLKKELKSLHDKFVLVPIDKAGNNVAIICKHFYAQTMHRELDYGNLTDNVENGNTYAKIDNLNSKQIFSIHSNFLKKFNLEVKKEDEKHAVMYWSPKMHKKVIGNRVIIASKVSSLKPLAEDVTKSFRCMFARVRANYRVIRYYTGLNFYGLLIIILMCQV